MTDTLKNDILYLKVKVDDTQYQYIKGGKTMFNTSVKPSKEFKEYNERYFTVMFDDTKESPDCYEWCKNCPCAEECGRYEWAYSCGIWEDCMGEDL